VLVASSDPSAAGQYFYNGLQQRGYSPMQAAVLAGNMQQESGFDPSRVNAPEGAFGSLQWRQDRLAGLQNYAASLGKSPSDPDVQMDFIVREMQGPEAQNALPFMSATDPQSANAALQRYIRYGDGSQPARLKYAMAFLPQAANGNGSAATGSQPAGGQAGNSAVSPGSTPQTPSGAPDRAQFLSQWGVTAPSTSGTSAAPTSPAAAPASSSATPPDRAAFLNSWGVNAGAAPVGGSAAAPAQPAPAAPQPIATGPGTYAGSPVTPGAAGNNPMAIQRPGPEQAVGDRAAQLRAATGGQPAPLQVPSWLSGAASAVGGASDAFQNAVMNNMLGIGPLVNGAVDAVGSRISNMLTGQSPDQAVATAHAQEDQQAAAHPIANAAGAAVGSVLPFTAVGPGGLAAKALGMGADYTGNAIGNALTRAALGGASSAVLSGADTAERGGNSDDIVHNMLTAGAIGGVAAPVMHGIGSLAGPVGKWLHGGPSAPETLANALTQDRLAPQNVNMLTQHLGPGAVVADVGQTTQKLAAKLAGSPGQAQNIVRSTMEARAADAGSRLPDAVNSTLGHGQPVGGLTDQIVAQQKAAAAPLYQAVRDIPLPAAGDLKAVMDTPIGESAFATASRLAANDGKLTLQAPLSQRDIASKVFSGELTPEEGDQMLRNPSATPTPKLTVGLVDYAKQALDDDASQALRAGRKNDARQASEAASALTSAVDTHLGGAPGKGPYAAARAAFAGPAKVLDAVDMGQQVFTRKLSPEDLQTAMVSMSPSEKDGLLQGAQAAVQEAIGDASSDAAGVRNAFRSSNAQRKLALLIGPQQAQALSDAVESHAALSGTERAVAGRVSKASEDFAESAVGPVQPSNASFKGLAKLIDVPALFMKARNAYANGYRAVQDVHLANMLTGAALSPEDAAAVAGAKHLTGGRVPAAAVALGIKNSLPNPQNPFLSAGPGQIDRVYRDGKWIPRVTVTNANVIGQ
jgi:hypothetical protein